MKTFFVFCISVFISGLAFAQSPDSVVVYKVSGDSSYVAGKLPDSARVVYLDFYQAGLSDARQYYSDQGPFWGGFASGFVLNIFGVVPTAVIASVPPNPYNVANPNYHLLAQNKEYYSGFSKGIQKRKVGKTSAGFGIGIASFTVIYIGALVIILNSF